MRSERDATYDCFYLALAEQRGGVLVSADKRLLRRVADTAWAGLATDLYALTGSR